MARVFTFLVIDSPGQSQQIIIWDTLEVTVGRGPDRDLVIPDSEVSRQHALFAMDGASHIVADLHTSNGTFVNGARVSRHQLRPGDVIELGPARVQFRQESESPKGKNVRFASQLKSFTPFGNDDEESGNRTVMGLAGAPGTQADYSDRAPQGEIEFDLGQGTGNTPAAVVDLDSVLDGGLEGVELASFEDEELTNLEKDPDEPPLPPRAARQAPPQARSAPPPAPRAAPAPPPPPAPAPAPRAAAPQAQAPRVAVPAAAEPSPSDTTARATLSIEIEGPRAVLKSVVAMLLDREISIPPVKIRLRRPQ